MNQPFWVTGKASNGAQAPARASAGYADSAANAWIVSMFDGNVGANDKSVSYYV